MFLRLVSDSFARRPRHKLLTGVALALGMAVATAALSVSLDVGDRLAQEFRSLGANLLITPQADSLPLEIGGVDYRPVNAGAYLPESELPKLKTIFWHNNIIAFAPVLDVPSSVINTDGLRPVAEPRATLIGTWVEHPVSLSDGHTFVTGIDRTNPWWQVEGRWFQERAGECVIGARLAEKLAARLGTHLYVARPGLSLPTANARSVALQIVGILSSGGSEDDGISVPLTTAQWLAERPGQYRKLYVSALTKPEDDFSRRERNSMTAAELERWSCSPYVSSIAYSIQQVLPGSEVRVIRRVAEGEGQILTRVRSLLWLVTFASLLAAALAVGASSAASVIHRRTEIGLMKALGAASAMIGFLLIAEQLLLAFVGGAVGYALGIILARVVGQRVFGAAPQPSVLVLLVVIGLAALVTLLGSFIPLRRASRYEPAPILRGE
jgi:putative ABC transport system permease protein